MSGWAFAGATAAVWVAYYTGLITMYMRGNQRNLKATLEVRSAL